MFSTPTYLHPPPHAVIYAPTSISLHPFQFCIKAVSYSQVKIIRTFWQQPIGSDLSFIRNNKKRGACGNSASPSCRCSRFVIFGATCLILWKNHIRNPLMFCADFRKPSERSSRVNQWDVSLFFDI